MYHDIKCPICGNHKYDGLLLHLHETHGIDRALVAKAVNVLDWNRNVKGIKTHPRFAEVVHDLHALNLLSRE
jgi:hypothetical protein